MEVTFDKIHNVVLETLQPKAKKADILQIIGNWYYLFLCSDEKYVSLKLPYYNPKSIQDVYQYLRLFLLAFKLANYPKLTFFKDTCLFDIFHYSKSPFKLNKSNCSLDFIREKGNVLEWANNVIVSKNKFLPVFKKPHCESADWDTINNTFKLFKAIRKHRLIEHPILLDLEENIFLSLSSGRDIMAEEYLLFETIAYDRNNSEDEDIEIEDKLDKSKISDQITLKYPYSRSIRSWFLKKGNKRFELDIYSRFCYSEISENAVVLLPQETFPNRNPIDDIISKITVFNTNHNAEVYDLMCDLRKKWQEYDFNKFTVPFPKYWFQYINKSLSKEEWLRQFNLIYPSVSEKPIIRDIEKVIIALHELNWAEIFISEIGNPVFLVPNMKGIRGKKIEAAFSSFRNYLLTANPKIEFIESRDNYNYRQFNELIVLEGFNVIDVVNIVQNNDPSNYRIVIPDFNYFNYQPWIKYHLANYLYEALLSPERQLLDKNFENNNRIWGDFKITVIKEVKSELKTYLKKYSKTLIEKEPEQISQESEDIELKNDEEIELIKHSRENITKAEILIISTTESELRLPYNSEVLIQRNTIVNGKAQDLNKGDYFISISELNSSIDFNKIIDKLSNVPVTAQRFQTKLGKYNNIYQILETRGLHYTNEAYFHSSYIIPPEKFTDSLFMIPKKRKHWEIICEFLSIDRNDMLQTWIAHYGRKQINEIRNIYRYILNLFLKSNLLGEAENPVVMEEVTNYVKSREAIFENSGEFKADEIAKSIVSSILNILEFREVKEIKPFVK